MDTRLFKEPAALFAIGCIITMLFLFIESRIRGEKKPYRDYITYGVYSGALLSLVMYISTYTPQPEMEVIRGDKFLLNRIR